MYKDANFIKLLKCLKCSTFLKSTINRVDHFSSLFIPNDFNWSKAEFEMCSVTDKIPYMQ